MGPCLPGQHHHWPFPLTTTFHLACWTTFSSWNVTRKQLPILAHTLLSGITLLTQTIPLDPPSLIVKLTPMRASLLCFQNLPQPEHSPLYRNHLLFFFPCDFVSSLRADRKKLKIRNKFKSLSSLGCLGGSVGGACDFSSGHDLAVRRFELYIRLCADSSEPAWILPLSISLSLPCSCPLFL